MLGEQNVFSLRPRNEIQVLMIWAISSLSRLQKMPTLEESLESIHRRENQGCGWAVFC